MSARKPSHSAMDEKEKDYPTSGQVHGSKQSSKHKKRSTDKERKDDRTVSKKHKTGSSPRTPQEVSPSKRGTSSHSIASSSGSGGIFFAGKNPEQKFKLVTSAPEQPLRHLPEGQGVLSVEQVTVQVTDHPHTGAPLITPSRSTDPLPLLYLPITLILCQ